MFPIQNLNEKEVLDQWSGLLEKKLVAEGLDLKENQNKIKWLSKYCQVHSMYEKLNENSSTLVNTPPMGSVAAPSNPSAYGAGSSLGGAQGTTSNVFYNGVTGSGDKFPMLLPLAIQVALHSIAMDLVPVIPMGGPTGMLPYLDFVYADGTLNNSGSGNKALVIELNVQAASGQTFTVGETYYVRETTPGAQNVIGLTFVGTDTVKGTPIFRVVEYSAGESLAISDIFTGGTSNYAAYADVASNATVVIENSEFVNKRADYARYPDNLITGFTGAGSQNQDDWTGTYHAHNRGTYSSGGSTGASNSRGASPMARETGEDTYYNTMGIELRSKFVHAETVQVAANVTTEQVQDFKKMYGMDVLSLIETTLVDQLTQHINKHILSRLFALGWSNHVQAFNAEGIDLNLHIGANGRYPTYYGKDDVALAFPATGTPRNAISGAAFENTSTIQRKLATRIGEASSVIRHRGRRGAGNFAVLSGKRVSALQDISGYQFAPFQNSINQRGDSVYPAGMLQGVSIYADPLMGWTDSRVCVGRKGDDIDPGAKFMPYLMAESISTIAEGTLAPKVAVKSRYSVVDAGTHPETQYVTFNATSDEDSIDFN